MSSTFASPEHQALRATIARFVDEQINPHVDDWEAEGLFPAHDLIAKLGQLGLLGISKPETCGGSGLDYSFSVVWAFLSSVPRACSFAFTGLTATSL